VRGLVETIARGGPGAAAAEAELCRVFAPRVRLYGLRHLRDEDRTRDLVQAVLLAVLEAARAGRIEEPDKLDRFVLATSRHLALRARAAERRSAGDEPLAALAVPEVEAVSLRALGQCYAVLDDRARAVVALTFQEDRSAEDIAARLSTTAGNVRVLRHRAVAALRRCLDEKGARA
jgi:RNA polymerase sigma-70 factor (ECF subfamily)